MSSIYINKPCLQFHIVYLVKSNLYLQLNGIKLLYIFKTTIEIAICKKNKYYVKKRKTKNFDTREVNV